jgi:hypothetical protein
MRNEIDHTDKIHEEIDKLEKQFGSESAAKIREDFEIYSKENKMGRKKLLEYFGL